VDINERFAEFQLVVTDRLARIETKLDELKRERRPAGGDSRIARHLVDALKVLGAALAAVVAAKTL